MKTLTLNSSTDGLQLQFMVSEAAGEAAGIIQLVHGMCEHKERYIPFMEWLSSKGYICVMHDHRGHGASVKSSDDLGYMYDGGWEALVNDIKDVNDWVKANCPALPLTMLGHSMGSMAVRSYVKRHDSSIDKLIVCGSPSDNPAKGAGKLLAAAFGRIKGWHFRPQLLQNMSFGAYNKPFEGEKGQDGKAFHSAWVCSDRDVLEAYHKDPLCQFVFTANGFYNLMGLMQDCYSVKSWAMSAPSLPVLFISGSEDPCRTDDKAFYKAVETMKKAGYSDVSSILYPGMRHEILNETEKMKVWEDVLDFIRK